ncbi:MAG: hypothetical protein WAQ57_00795 [Candidatus Saccharimonadales bacterium]
MAPTANKGTKRVQVDRDKTMIFIVVAAASVVTVVALMVSRGFWSQANYLDRVASKKEKAVSQLKDNQAAATELKTSYDTFRGQNPNLIGGSPAGQGDRDGDNTKLILDALPSKYDFPALTASLEQLLFGYKINGIMGTDDTVVQQTVVAGDKIEIPVSVDVTGNYDAIKDLIGKFDKSIRPFSITQLELRGSNAMLQANFRMKTYYEPEKGLEITEEVVK